MSKPTGQLVSVVTPVYNGAEYIAECIEGVVRQTYEHWEYVILDNCSTDQTLEIARSYEAHDSRIRVVAADVFVGAVENANRVLRELSPASKYCKVLHADDWLFPECLERMVELAEQNPSVGIVSAYRLEESKVTLDGLPHTISVLPGREIARATLLDWPYGYLFGSPSSLLIRSDLIRARDPFYNPENRFTNDLEACYEVLHAADFGFVHQVLTFTRRAEGSPFSAYVRLGAQLPDAISLYERYGPVYLEQDEYRRHLAVLIVNYGLFLARNSPRFANLEFRSHHRRALASLLKAVDRRDVRAGVLLQLQRMRETRRLRPGLV